ncbi:MAG TPA: protein translocase subunit SecD [Chloroflexota bacterium]|nr:protein translocase subunit SecD [Chloroflexota bacterium]
MRQKNLRMLVGIILVAAVAIFIAIPDSPGIHLNLFGMKINQDYPIREGLDLKGGIQVLLEADVPAGQQVDQSSMQAAEFIVQSRVNALGVSEPLVQLASGNRIIVELPGVKDPDAAVKTLGSTGLLEFVDAGSTPLDTGTVIVTSQGAPSGSAKPATTTVYPTVMTGKDLKSAEVGFDQYGRPQINFTLTSDGAKKFSTYTTANVGKYLVIALDKKVIEAPVIQQPITDGQGVINGQFTLQDAQDLVVQLRYGSLPIPLKVVDSQEVGPTLGSQAVQQSIIAGIIGLGIVLAFMVLNYRLPGLLADLALLIYAAVTFALFRMIPVTLTLAGIAGFILSIGMAVDANILIFERMKEELRAGRSLHAAIEAGFERAWPSIRDSNFSTLITCTILYWFGANFGASIIQGFALTLAIGVVVSLFTAILVSRTFLALVVDNLGVRRLSLFGLSQPPEVVREGVA